jgi:predicted tellurium resistance membrane protein TerC
MAWLADPQAWVAFVTLTVLELVLGIDNIVFISILAGKLPQAQQQRARTLAWGWPCCCGSPCFSHCPGSSALLRRS